MTTVGAEPGEVVPAGRMVVQIARAGGRDAVFDVPAQIKDTAPTNPEITVALTTDPEGHREGPRPRGVAARRSGDRDVPGARRPHRPARRPAARLDGDRHACGSRPPPAIEIPGSALVRPGAQSAVWIVDPKTETVSHAADRGRRATTRTRVVVAGGLESRRRRRDRRRPGPPSRPEGAPARSREVIGPNLSEWAIKRRSLIVYFMIAAIVAGTISFLRLGRAEDPVFTFRTMIVFAAWPGAIARGDAAPGHRADRAQAPGDAPSRPGAQLHDRRASRPCSST